MYIGNNIETVYKKTLMDGFVSNKLSMYVEPQRKGTPKGEDVGFSTVKYKASLHVGCKKTKIKELAERLNISYGLLRKWRTEEAFKKKIKEHQKEFTEVFIDSLEQLAESYNSKIGALQKNITIPTSRNSRVALLRREDFKKYSDYVSYAESQKEMIEKKFAIEVGRTKYPYLMMLLYLLIAGNWIKKPSLIFLDDGNEQHKMKGGIS